jgi:glyoxylase-like metal-dependent hydrolase (beta-lactamase superfamily II)
VAETERHYATQVADDVWLLDTFYQGEPGVIASYLLTGTSGLALIDVGSGASVTELLAGVRAAGFDPEQIEHLILTHIHLDHAGASGILTRLLPRARVYVHLIGAPHLIDPTRLIRSATRIYGDRMHELWGEMEPVPADRLTRLDDGDVLRVGSRTLTALYTPGHAVHHLAFHDAARREIFTGDVAGVRLQGMDFVRPPTPPPDLSIEDWNASIVRLAALDATRLYLPHFGLATGVVDHLAQLRAHLAEWGALLLPAIRENAPDAQVARASHGMDDIAIRRYELATNYLMSAQGYVRYYQKHHPELL